MSQLLYVVVAVVVSGVVSAVIWYRHEKPPSLHGSIEEFAKELKALAPDRHHDNRRDR